MGRGHHADMAFYRQRPFADSAARGGAIEHGQMLVFQARRAFQRHRPAAIEIGGGHIVLRKAHGSQHVEGDVVQVFIGEAQHVLAEIRSQRPLVEDEADVERGRQIVLDGIDMSLGETKLFQ